MIIKNSLKNLIRSKAKTLIFFALILLVTVTMSLSLSILVSVDNFLENSGDEFTTVAVIEYMGLDYPDIDVYDESMQKAVKELDFSAIENNEYVLHFERSARALGYVEGYSRTDRSRPLQEKGVFTVFGINPKTRFITIEDAVFSSQRRAQDDNGIYIIPTFTSDGQITELLPDHNYIVQGYIVDRPRTSFHDFQLYPFFHDAAMKAGIVNGDEYIYLDITDGKNAEKAETFYLIADTYKIISNSLDVYAVEDIRAFYEFNQNQIFVEKGRYFTQEEYDSGAKVCIVSPLFAKQYKAEVGDIIPLSLAICEDSAYYESYWAGTGFQFSDEYEIVGITNTTRELNYNVYIPNRPEYNFSKNQVGYTVANIILDNDGASAFYDEIKPILPDRMRLTIYDQGYTKTKESFTHLRQIAVIVAAVSMMAGIAIIILFCFLFVYRQRGVSETMQKLGTGRRKVCTYFLFGAGAISLASGVVGSVVSYYLSGIAIKILGRLAHNQAVSFSKYSNAGITIVKDLVYAPKSQYSFFIFTALGVLLCVLIFAFGFTAKTFLHKKKVKKKAFSQKKLKKGHYIGFGKRAFKYSLESIFRGGLRSLVVPVVSLAVVIFLSHLAFTYTGYQSELKSVESVTEITGVFTDIYGKQVKNVVLDAYQLKDLYNSGYIGELNVTRATKYNYMGRFDREGGMFLSAKISIPDSPFAFETYFDNLQKGNWFVNTNNIKATPEFYFSENVEVRYMDGYSSDMFYDDSEEVLCCVISDTMMAEQSIEYGDIIQLDILRNYYYGKDTLVNFKVVGSFEKQDTRDNIYCQLAGFMPPKLLYDNKSEDNEELFKYVFDTASFTLADTSRLDEFKKYLGEYGFSTPNSIGTYRTFIVVQDERANSSLGTLKQQIKYINVLYPVLYILVGIIAAVVAYLMIVSRRKEYAIMRGLGADKLETFRSFFYEQMVLCLAGVAAGIAVGVVLYGKPSLLTLLLSTGFVVCYIAGCVISASKMNKIPVLAVLKYED